MPEPRSLDYVVEPILLALVAEAVLDEREARQFESVLSAKGCNHDLEALSSDSD
jgi:hypothetical protein